MEDLDCGSAELSVNLGLTRGHGSLLLAYDTSAEETWGHHEAIHSTTPFRYDFQLTVHAHQRKQAGPVESRHARLG